MKNPYFVKNSVFEACPEPRTLEDAMSESVTDNQLNLYWKTCPCRASNDGLIFGTLETVLCSGLGSGNGSMVFLHESATTCDRA